MAPAGSRPQHLGTTTACACAAVYFVPRTVGRGSRQSDKVDEAGATGGAGKGTRQEGCES